jgi:VWFA-related protein
MIGYGPLAASTVLLFAFGVPELFALPNNSLIPIDVVVQDSSGNPVTDLAASDFDIAVDGRAFPLTGVEFVGEGASRPREIFAPPFPAPGDALRSLVILIDDLGIGESAMQKVRNALDAVGQDMRPGDAVAIVTTGDTRTTLPRLSTSKSAAGAAAGSTAPNPSHRLGVLDAGFCKRPDPASSILQTLSVLRRAVGALRDLPGRKSVVFVSEGFVPKPADVSGAWKDLLLYANRSDVDVSTLDPRGAISPSLSQKDCGGLREDELSASRRTLTEIAAATSGGAIADTADFREAMSRLMRRGSGYYLIGYPPAQAPSANIAPDPAPYHAVSIHLKRPGAVALYHSSLFESRAGGTGARIGAAIASPFALTSVHTSVSARFWHDTADGAVIQSAVWIDARDLTLSAKSGGGSEVTFELAADTLDESSRLINHFSEGYKVDVPVQFRTTVLGDGLTQRLRLPVKNPGVYQVRVAVHDRSSDRIGSDTGFVVVPDLARGHLALSGIVIGKSGETGAAADASPRRFHPGQTVTVTYQILNASRDGTGSVGVEVTTSLIRAGSVLVTSQPAIVDGTRQPDLKRILRAREFQLGEDLEPGTYSLRIDARDRNVPNGSGAASQSVEFEVN